MAIDQRSGGVSSRRAHASAGPLPRWGYVSRTAGRYGTVSSRLVVYPPGATDEQRFAADLAHRYAPIAVMGGVLGWAILSGLGWSPEGAAVLMALATIPAGVFLAVRAAPVRRRTMALATCCFAARPQDRDLAELNRFEALAGAIEGAADA
ncbi:hypothetical protein J2Y69_001653 [Microbacterium resistens]|uniref:Uncharacterized protein n=1 Tax=Microbacterium resistens TaxID=156977 RepID=A0ABU1SBQ7_9MICO|nr:DUF6611 family protein [Microbacterium resistens]MDR6867054.1 hypothetical protein [Microbacterium resistens]